MRSPATLFPFYRSCTQGITPFAGRTMLTNAILHFYHKNVASNKSQTLTV
jgi:hypothetical protein